MQLSISVLHAFVIDRGAPIDKLSDRLLISLYKFADVGQAMPQIGLDTLPNLLGEDLRASLTRDCHKCCHVFAATGIVGDLGHVGFYCRHSLVP